MRLSSPPETVWTGVVISENGEILTTSQTLGDAPVVDIRLWDGRQGQACVTGRDDVVGLALLEPLIGPSGAYDYLALSGESPSIGQQLELLQYSSFTPALDRRPTEVKGHKLRGGYGYTLIRAADNTTADGAVLVDENGRMQGMRMPVLWLLQNQITNPGEVAAVAAPEVASVALPALRSGRMHTLLVPPRSGVDGIPLLPIVFHGEITIDGVPAPVGALLHAKVSKEGEPDYWQSAPIGTTGEYVLPVSAAPQTYSGGSVEFWMDCKRSPATAVYEGFHETPPRVVEQSLAF